MTLESIQGQPARWLHRCLPPHLPSPRSTFPSLHPIPIHFLSPNPLNPTLHRPPTSSSQENSPLPSGLHASSTSCASIYTKTVLGGRNRFTSHPPPLTLVTLASCSSRSSTSAWWLLSHWTYRNTTSALDSVSTRSSCNDDSYQSRSPSVTNPCASRLSLWVYCMYVHTYIKAIASNPDHWLRRLEFPNPQR